MKGWECPKCGNVYSPKVQECSECNRAKEQWVPNYPNHPGWVYKPVTPNPYPWFAPNYPWFPPYEITCRGAE